MLMERGEAEITCQLGYDNMARCEIEAPNNLPDFIFSIIYSSICLHLLSSYYMQDTVLAVSEQKLLTYQVEVKKFTGKL